MREVQIRPEGDSAVLLVFGDEIRPDINRRISAVTKMIRAQQIEGIVDLIPSFCALLVSYDPRIISYAAITERLRAMTKVDTRSAAEVRRVIEIPVLYGGTYGPDLPTVSEHAKLPPEEVIKIHTQPDYLIYMLGFLPGFTYLGGLDERIHTPRLAEPRLTIPAGSVGIAAGQTGIYPMDSPGGWQLIGITPVKTYEPDRKIPILVSAGEYIRFKSVDDEEFMRVRDLVAKKEYECTVYETDENGKVLSESRTNVYGHAEEDSGHETGGASTVKVSAGTGVQSDSAKGTAGAYQTAADNEGAGTRKGGS